MLNRNKKKVMITAPVPNTIRTVLSSTNFTEKAMVIPPTICTNLRANSAGITSSLENISDIIDAVIIIIDKAMAVSNDSTRLLLVETNIINYVSN